MIILQNKDKEFRLVPRTRKVVSLTEKLKAKNLNELIFNALYDENIKVLAELIKSFAEDENEKVVFTSLDPVYDFIDSWKQEDDSRTINDLFAEVTKVVNEMGFFKKKMTEEELMKQISNPSVDLDLKTIITNSAQKAVDEMAQEEFRGYKG